MHEPNWAPARVAGGPPRTLQRPNPPAPLSTPFLGLQPPHDPVGRPSAPTFRYCCPARRAPESLLGPILLRYGDICLEFPLLTGLFDDLARVLLVLTVVLCQTRLGVKDGHSDLVEVRIGRMHQHIQV